MCGSSTYEAEGLYQRHQRIQLLGAHHRHLVDEDEARAAHERAALPRRLASALAVRRRHIYFNRLVRLAAGQAELEVHGVAAFEGDGDLVGVRARHARVAGVARRVEDDVEHKRLAAAGAAVQREQLRRVWLRQLEVLQADVDDDELVLAGQRQALAPVGSRRQLVGRRHVGNVQLVLCEALVLGAHRAFERL